MALLNFSFFFYNLSLIDLGHIGEHEIKLLADRGFSNIRLVVPIPAFGRIWNNTQMSKRSVVETVIGTFFLLFFCVGIRLHAYSVGRVKTWKAANHRFRANPELQALALMVIYQLANIRLKQSLIRP